MLKRSGNSIVEAQEDYERAIKAREQREAEEEYEEEDEED